MQNIALQGFGQSRRSNLQAPSSYSLSQFIMVVLGLDLSYFCELESSKFQLRPLSYIALLSPAPPGCDSYYLSSMGL